MRLEELTNQSETEKPKVSRNGGKKDKQSSKASTEELLTTLGDFTSKENWDKFFTIRGTDDSFEWYAEWTELHHPLLSLLAGNGENPSSSPPLQILVPGCGNSKLSENLYDAGFREITNIDFSKVVISDMLKRNVRDRPGMRWRVMDMTQMKVEDESFDVVLDKGGLDALMEPKLGPKLGNQYLSEVKRLCSLTLLLIVVEIRLLVCMKALENENQIRKEYSIGPDILYSLEDLLIGAKAIVLDAKESSCQFTYHCGVFIVPKTRAHEWLFSSEEGQWLVVESSKAARLIMIIMDSSHTNANMDDIQKDLSPLVKQLAPGKDDNSAQIPFMMAGDGIKERKTVHKVISSLTGSIIVEDVVYENVADDVSRPFPSSDLVFRRLVFQRAEGLVQSEALLTRDESSHKIVEEKKKTSSSKSKKKGSQKRNNASSKQLKVYHDYMASSYHMGIISGFTLMSSYLESVESTGKTVNAVIIGLGAGLLPMFLHGCMPSLQIEVVELDAVVLSLARDYFGFAEDERLKVHIADGIKFVREVKHFAVADGLPAIHEIEDASGSTKPSPDESCSVSYTEARGRPRVDILIIDVDSSDSSSGMACPAADFVEESFLLTVKDALSEQGLFIVNLVSRSPAVKDMIISRMKAVFNHLFSLQLEEDINMVLFGLCSEVCLKEDCFPEAACQLDKLLKFKHQEIGQSIIDSTKKIRRLK
ncbi:EEF1A LYSINE AND N-TERMINAL METHYLTRANSFERASE [Salix purpurea]|uniref:EEF1A LYSINE AND N-TERMINAL METHYLTRANSFERASE n=1 Tax=Salix purpurea TaxID=77065 RepID=A0A9Q1A1N1_SALPP|nr:EEF1A LYSINE AND N-TERMINAL METHYLTRANSFERASE [Salix purpurea]